MKKILVVDDDMINRKLLNVLVKKAGNFEVMEAENGLEALNIIKNEPIDMVLLDIIMPVMDGLDLLKILKSEPQILQESTFKRISPSFGIGFSNSSIEKFLIPFKIATFIDLDI